MQIYSLAMYILNGFWYLLTDNDDMPIEIENDSGNDKLELQNEELKETIKQEVIVSTAMLVQI